MKKLGKLMVISILTLLCVMAAACTHRDTNKPVESVSIVGADSVTVNTETTYTAIITPADSTHDGIVWAISGENTIGAAISKAGVFKAASAGSVTITATAGGVSGNKTLTVEDVVMPPTEGLIYTPINDGMEYEVSNETATDSHIVIPPLYNGKPVTGIGSSAFYEYSSLTGITIPDRVTSIGGYAFSGCTGLTSITIPDSVISIGNYAFRNCTGLKSITIHNGVTSIGSGAFSGCSGLTSITIPGSVTSIGDEAFFQCTGLTSITIPDGVTRIGNQAFSGCKGLTTITIPDSVTSIGGNAFIDCKGLTSITIPDSVTSIGGYAFHSCTGLTSIIIPNGVTSIGIYAFRNCTGLTSITIPGSASIGGNAFYDCTNLTDITFNGTQAQWNAIYTPNLRIPVGTTVTCTDGEITIA